MSLSLLALGGCSDSPSSGVPDAGASIGPPSVVSTTPEANDNHIDPSANVEAAFSSALLVSSLGSAQITLHRNNVLVPAQVAFDGTTAVLDPEEELLPSAYYTASLTSGVVDNDGVALAPYQWSFYTDGNGWSADELIEIDSAGDAENPQISVESNGDAVAVWEQSDGSQVNIYANRYSASTGSWGSAQLIEIDNVGDANDPQISVDPSGNAIAVWEQGDGTRDNIYANRYSASTGSWGTAELIESEDGYAYNPQISADASGNMIAVWNQNDGVRLSIYANRYSASTGSWGTAVLIEADASQSAYTAEISVGASGDAVAVWRQGSPSRDIHANHYSVSTGSWGTATLIETDDAGHAYYPQVSVDDSGNAVVVWHQNDGTSDNIYSNRYSVSAGSWGAAALIQSDDAGDAGFPQIGVGPSGDAIAVWHQSDGTQYNVYANRYSSSAGSWGAAALVESDNAGGGGYPQVSVDDNGDAVVVWHQSDGTDFNVYANRYVSSSGSWGDVALIDTGSAGNALYPQIGVDPGGNAIAIWYQFDGTYSNIKSSLFDLGVVSP